jgi:branched-chain amino acid transport system ATP-binding protein
MMFEIKDLHVHYGKMEAIKGISLNAEEATIVAVLGSNGAGKSTILKAISGLEAPSSGQIWFQGKRIDGRPPHAIAGLGISQVPEGRGIFLEMTVLENLEMGFYLRNKRREITRDLKDIYQRFPVLEQRKKQIAGSLSGGEQQMLALGRALLSKPKVLLMDEPSLGLSPILCIETFKMIKQMNSEGLTIILVEQNARMALELAHTAYIMERGKVSLEGIASNLIHNEEVITAYLGG